MLFVLMGKVNAQVAILAANSHWGNMAVAPFLMLFAVLMMFIVVLMVTRALVSADEMCLL